MKTKKQPILSRFRSNALRKWHRVRVVLIFIGLIFFSANAMSRNKVEISLQCNGVSLSEVLDKIKAQSNLKFWYSNDEVNDQEVVAVNVSKGSIDEVLTTVLKKQGLAYKVNGNHITIYKPNEIKQKGIDKKIRGRILDETGEPIPGVNVRIKGKDMGVVSDITGYYIIDASSGQQLVFSFIGYYTEEVPIKNKEVIDIVLRESVNELDEAVVVGMGTQRKASVVGSISAVPVNNIKAPQRSLTSALSGRIAGAVVVQRTGEPGQDDANFWIRGISTFGANKTPLILVDGVERSMSDLSIDEIESISVLKDASATAVYGVRAANGVVLVTTRKGVAQKASVEVKLEYGVTDLPDLPDYLDGANYARLYNEAFGSENYSKEYIEHLEKRDSPYLHPNVNWFDEIFKKTSDNMNASINIRGGGNVARYFINVGYLEDNGNFKNSSSNDYKSNISLKRYNFRSNIDITLTKKTIVNLEIGANLIDTHTPGVGGLGGRTPAQEIFYHTNIATPISNPVKVPYMKDNEGNYVYGWGAPAQVGESNPAERLLGSGYGTFYRSQIMSQLKINQNLDFLLDGLKFVGAFSFDSNNSTQIKRRKHSSTYNISGFDEDTGEYIVNEVDKGIDFLLYSKDLMSDRAKELKGQLLYDQVFKDRHRVGGMLMYYQRNYINGAAGSAILSLPYKKQGVAARTTYSYADRYFAEFNLGYNGSENFPKGKRFGLFPAGAVGYLISNESFWKIKQIDFLKIRGSIGLVGAEALPGGQRFGYLSTYGSGLGEFNWGLTTATKGGVGEDREGVKNLTWEKGLKKNIGFELKMFNNRLSIDMDYFHERRKDILVQRNSLPGIAGLNSKPFANMGEMVNQGIESTIEFNGSYGDFGYRIYGNYAFTRNKIKEMDEPFRKWNYRMRTGHRFGQHFGLIAIGLFEDQQDIDTSPEQKLGVVRPGDVKYLDINGDGVIDHEDETAIGYSSIPEIIYGFGAQLEYKRFDLGIFFRGQGNVSYSLGGSTFVPFIEGVGKHNLFKKALDRWTEDNPRQDAFYPRISNGRSTNNWTASSRNIYDGSFLRLSDVEIGYTFDKKLIAPLGLKALRVYTIGSNLALFSKWKLWDPETGTSNGSNYPNPRKINFGLRATF